MMRQWLLAMLIIVTLGLAGCARTPSQGLHTSTPQTASSAPALPTQLAPTIAPPFAAPSERSATTTPPPSTATLNQPFEIVIGQQVRVGSDLDVTFVRIDEDSRCPKSVACVWSGVVTAVILVQRNGQQDASLTLSNPNLPKQADHTTYQNLTIQLLNVAPARETPDRPIKQSDYVATLRIS